MGNQTKDANLNGHAVFLAIDGMHSPISAF
jgi:hypothetical protein